MFMTRMLRLGAVGTSMRERWVQGTSSRTSVLSIVLVGCVLLFGVPAGIVVGSVLAGATRCFGQLREYFGRMLMRERDTDEVER